MSVVIDLNLCIQVQLLRVRVKRIQKGYWLRQGCEVSVVFKFDGSGIQQHAVQCKFQ